MRWIGGVTGAAVAVAAVAVGAVLLDDTENDPVRSVDVVAADDESAAPPGARSDRAQGEGPPPWARGREPGPPPWARGGADKTDKSSKSSKASKPSKAAKPSKDWVSAWRAMTPKQREQMMSRLADEHAAGMRAFGRCTADGGDECEKPPPPGLAKKAELGP